MRVSNILKKHLSHEAEAFADVEHNPKSRSNSTAINKLTNTLGMTTLSCLRRLVMITILRRNIFLIRFFGILVIASLLTSFLFLAHVDEDKRESVTREGLQRDFNLAKTVPEKKTYFRKKKRTGLKAGKNIPFNPLPMSSRPEDYLLNRISDESSSLRRSSEEGKISVARGLERTKKSKLPAVWDIWSSRQRARRTVKELKPAEDVENDEQLQIFTTDNLVKDNTKEFNTFTKQSEAIFTATPDIDVEKQTTYAKYQSNVVRDPHLEPNAYRHRNVKDKLHNTGVTVIRPTEKRGFTAQINSPVMHNSSERQDTDKSRINDNQKAETLNTEEIVNVKIRDLETSTPANKDLLRHPTATRTVKLHSRATSFPPVHEGNRLRTPVPGDSLEKLAYHRTPNASPEPRKAVNIEAEKKEQAETSHTKEIVALRIGDSATSPPTKKAVLRHQAIAQRSVKLHTRATSSPLVHDGNSLKAPVPDVADHEKRNIEKPRLTSHMDSPALGYSSVQQSPVKSRIIENKQSETSNTEEIAAVRVKGSATSKLANNDLLRHPTIAPTTGNMHSRSTGFPPVHERNRLIAPALNEPPEKVTSRRTPDASRVQRKTVIIVAEPRTGSSFLGDAFNQNPDVFYLFEPLHGVVLDPKQHEHDPRPMQFLAGILGCKFLSLRYVREIQNFRRFSSNALSSPPLCREKTSLNTAKKNKCSFLTTLNMENVCTLDYKVTVIKILTSRIPRNKVESLFPLCNWTTCSIIYLVRDPRPVVFSHMKVGIKTWSYFRGLAKEGAPRPSVKMYSAQICRQIEANVRTFLKLTKKTNNRYHMLRYEDLARNPVETLQRMYKISGITMHNDTLRWIKNHTSNQNTSSKNGQGYNFSTRRDSKANIDNWRLEVDPCIVNVIEDSCRPLIQLLGYKLLNRSEETQYNLTVSLYDHINMIN